MSNISLRERKYAKIKSDLMHSVISRLASQPLADITVKEVCHDALVSEATFFNYFSSKQEVIIYSVQLWSIDAGWSMQQCLESGGTHLDAIRVLFDRTADSETRSPGLMRAVIAYQATNWTKFIYEPLTRAEYALHFPDRPGIEQFEGKGIEILLFDQLEAAKQNHELPTELDLKTLGLTLISVFFITPVLVGIGKENELREVYSKQLNQLFTR